MFLDITPVPKPRMVQSDRWKKRPEVLRYRAFCDELRLKLKELPIPLWVTFHMPMPDSWSEKKKLSLLGKPHCQRPDSDNILKAVLDGMLDEDSHVHEIHARKVWAREGGLEFKQWSGGQ